MKTIQALILLTVAFINSELFAQNPMENLVFVKGGTYQMGTDKGWDAEGPVHTVKVNDFYIGKYEVTFEEYCEFLNSEENKNKDISLWIEILDHEIKLVDGKFVHKKGLENYPVVSVTKNGAVAYSKWKGGRLPTEAEWEFAARGGVKSKNYLYSGGDDYNEVSWNWHNASDKSLTGELDHKILYKHNGRRHPVGQKKSNELGIYDMSGNVFEWVHDWFDKDYYKISPVDNPGGPKTGNEVVARGGSWNDYKVFLKPTTRLHGKPIPSHAKRIGGYGFRIAFSPQYDIAYTSAESGNPDIYLIELNGKSKLQLTDYPLRDGYAANSPDGKSIVFYAYYDGHKTWSIHIMNRDGSNRKRLTAKKNVWDSAPAWSADGKQIIFSRKEEGIYKIMVMNPDGSNLHQLNIPFGLNPGFTKDGRVLYSTHWEENGEICIANIDGTNVIQLTNNNSADGHPKMSPDGKQIVFYSERDGNKELYIMDYDGKNKTRLTKNAAADWSPAWSPDSSRIAFDSMRDGNYEIYVMQRDGSSLKRITDNNVADTGPNWLVF